MASDNIKCALCAEDLNQDYSNAMAECTTPRCALKHVVLSQYAWRLLLIRPCVHGRRMVCDECDLRRSATS